MVCPRCGKQGQDDSTKFCLGCGLALFVVAQQAGGADKLKAPPKPQPSLIRRTLPVALGGLAVVVLLAGMWKLSAPSTSEPPPPPAEAVKQTKPEPTPEPATNPDPAKDPTLIEPAGPVVAAIDAKAIALKPAAQVFAMIGKPQSLEPGEKQTARYKWGSVAFHEGELTDLDYTLPKAASGTKEVLARIGLEQTSRPAKGAEAYTWDATTNQYLTCCGLEMDSVRIAHDLTRVAVHFSRRRQ